MSYALNMTDTERWMSVLSGAALAYFGLKDRSVPGALVAAGGGALMAWGTVGYCPAYASMGRQSVARDDTRAALSGSRGTLVDERVVINASPDQLYERWRALEDLPRLLPHLAKVTTADDQRSHWVAKGPAGISIEWDAEIINDVPGEIIAWRSLANAPVVSAGSVRFVPLAGNRGTILHVRLQYSPPAGKAGSGIAWILGHEPTQTIREDLRRFKAVIEAGEAPTTDGQPRGAQSILNYD